MSLTQAAESTSNTTSISSRTSTRSKTRSATQPKGSAWGWLSPGASPASWAATWSWTAPPEPEAASQLLSQDQSSDPSPRLRNEPRPSQQTVKIRGRVLIVEDDRNSSRAMEAILERLGWDVFVAENVQDAQSFLRDKFDAIILDLMLPDGDGAHILRYARQNKSATLVAITTGVTDPARLADLKPFSPDLVLSKPIDLAALLRRLNQLNLQS